MAQCSGCRWAGRRAASAGEGLRMVEVEDSYTLIPEDQPDLLARLLREFVPAPAVP